jgi:integrase
VSAEDPRRLELTDPFIRSRKPAATVREYRDTIARGLILRVLPSGLMQWSVRYRHRGKQRRAAIGDYPGVTLAKARGKATRTLIGAKDGSDPAAELRAAKRPASDTVASLVEDYLKRHARPNKRTAAEDERTLTVEVLPAWRDRSVTELTRRDVRALLEAIVDRGSPVMANRVLAVVRKMLNFAVDHDWIDANPAGRMSKPTREVSRDRVLTDDEIRRLWQCLSRFPTTAERQAPGRKRTRGAADDPICPISPALAAVQKVRLLTAQRGGEVIAMKWADLELPAEKAKAPRSGWWTIPGSDTKNGEPHRVPLTEPVITLIEAQRKKKADDERKGENCRTRDQAESDDAGATYVFVGSGASLRDRAKKAPSALAKVLGFDFRGHDLRRTAATRMAAAGIPREHVGKVLNHVEGGARATRVYDRHTYDAEKRTALETWTRVLTGILEQKPKTGAAVVPITKRTRA